MESGFAVGHWNAFRSGSSVGFVDPPVAAVTEEDGYRVLRSSLFVPELPLHGGRL